MMATSSQIPMNPAARNPASPMTEMPKKSGGISEMTISADPMIRDAMMMEKAMRLEIWSWVASILSKSFRIRLKESFFGARIG
jgi:hypothetical protein